MTNPLITGAYVQPQVGVGDNGGGPSAQVSTAVVVDGTPMRVVMLAGVAAASLWLLRKAGFKFNVGVS